jgi:hypothetical protein
MLKHDTNVVNQVQPSRRSRLKTTFSPKKKLDCFLHIHQRPPGIGSPQITTVPEGPKKGASKMSRIVTRFTPRQALTSVAATEFGRRALSTAAKAEKKAPSEVRSRPQSAHFPITDVKTTAPPINILQEPLDLKKHLSPFIITSSGYHPRTGISEGDLVPVECPVFDRVIARSKAIVGTPAPFPHPNIDEKFHSDRHMVIKFPQIQSLSQGQGFTRSTLCAEIDTILSGQNVSKIKEEFGKPQLEEARFKITFDPGALHALVEKDMPGFPQLQKLTQFWAKLLTDQALRDDRQLSTLAVSVRRHTFGHSDIQQDPNVKGWLIPHADRDVFPCEYSAFGTIKSVGFNVLNNVYAKDGTLIDTSGPSDMLLLDDRAVRHDAVYLYDDPSGKGSRYFINVSAF